MRPVAELLALTYRGLVENPSMDAGRPVALLAFVYI